MTFPSTVQDIKTELYLNAAWTDVSSDVRRDPGVTITRGRQDEGSTVDASKCDLAFDNTSGKYSPRNPLGTYYGQLGRNTPIRVSVLSDKSRMPIDQDTGTAVDNYASTSDTAALDLATDFDIRFEADLDSWFDRMDLVAKYTSTGNQRSYAFITSTGGYLRVLTSVAGTANTVDVKSTETLPTKYGHQAVRVTFDANNGAAGNTVTFYYSDTISGTWIQLGEPVITAGTTTLFNSTSPMYVGPRSAGGGWNVATRGKIYAAEIRSSIGGTIVANPDFSIQAEGATSFADSTGKTWTLVGTSTTLRDYRFRGEVSSWPQSWDQSGTDVYTRVQGAGILRRLGQGKTPVPSSINRSVSSLTNLVAYWPAEDGELSTSLANAFPNGTPMVIKGTPTLANDTVFIASKPLPTLALASFTGTIANYTSTNTVEARMYLAIPAAGIANGIIIATVTTTGTASTFNLKYGTGGTLAVDVYASDGTLLLATGATAFNLNGAPKYVSLRLIDNGTGIDVNIGAIDAITGNNDGESAVSNLAANQVGRAKKLVINPEKRMDDVVMGHFSVLHTSGDSVASLASAIVGWQGESAGERIKRLCGENDIPFFQIASVENSAPLGPQRISTALDLIREAADADLGILYEPRDQYGLEYRPRKTLNNQNSRVTLDYSANQLTSFEPIDDDQNTVNDVIVIRDGGSSFHATDTTSALSVSEPPNGVGVYDESVTLSLFEDDQCADQAGWRLHLGTVDEARFPVISCDMTSPSFLAATTNTFNLLALDVGDRLVVTDSPSWLPPDDVQQIAQGFTEYLANFERKIEINCSPASVWEIGRYAFDTDDTRNQYKYSSDGTVTTEALDTTETGIDVTTASGPVWTTAADQLPYDIMIGGERMTVTAVTGTTANQVFTVTRSVNGIVKSHSTGATVKLFRPAVYSF